MAVGADQNLHPRPGGADRAHQPAQAGADLGAGGAAGGAQHGGDGPALAVEPHDRLEAVVVVVGVEQPQLLAAMHGIEGVVEVEDDAARHLAEGRAVERDHRPAHRPAHPQQGAGAWQVLQPRDGRLRAPRGAVRRAVERQLEHGVVSQRVGVVAVLVASRDHQQAEAQDVGDAVHHALGRARVVAAGGGEAFGDAEPACDLTQGRQTTIRRELAAESWPPSKRAMRGLPATGDRPGSGDVDSTLAGMGSGDGGVLGLQPNPLADQRLAPCPSALVHNSG